MSFVPFIPLLPAAAFVLLAPMSRRARNASRWVSVGAIAGSAVLSVAAFLRVWPGGEDAATRLGVTFGEVAGHAFRFGLRLDPLSAAMLLVVTLVGLAVQVYSLSYMREDERIGWYYAVMSLFSAAMLALVLADDFLMLYMAWEVMGLCSYLLIGFWHEEEAPRKASIKAFLTTRVGDAGFAVGLAAMYSATGTFRMVKVLGAAQSWAPGVALAVAVGLLMGAMGKSAQVPLHVWLPDAMAGPTPASALIHAATMVAAGVFLVARAMPVFEAAGVLPVVMFVGILTALVGGLLAVVQYDIKRVLAYSTISQLGYMFAALGAGGAVAGLFHLVTHAFFKSLLFLGAGAIIHATHTQDMREMGGLAKKMRLTTVVFTVGALALAGVFPLSGFFSKDEILTVLLHGEHYVTFGLALFAALVTAFYVARLWVRVFAGQPGEHSRDAHDGDAAVSVPMAALAAVTLALGFASPQFARFLGHEGEWPQLALALTSTGVALAGLFAGWLVFARGAVDTVRLKNRFAVLYAALDNGFYFDAVYKRMFVAPALRVSGALASGDLKLIDGLVNLTARGWKGLSEAAAVFDVKVIDGGVNGLAAAVWAAGSRLRRIQLGRVQSYQRFVLGALLALLMWVLLKGA